MTNHIELRLPYHENVYVARICGRSKRYRFERDFDCVRRKREAAELDGVLIKKGVVYHLPLAAAVYEVRDEENSRYYIGTRPGDPALYAVSLSRIEVLIDHDPDIDEVIGSKIEDFKQSAGKGRNVCKKDSKSRSRGSDKALESTLYALKL
jgi:hypothetical protein